MKQISLNIVAGRKRTRRSLAETDYGPKVGRRFDIGGPVYPYLIARSSHPVARDPEEQVGTFIMLQRRFLHRVGPHPVRDAFDKDGLREQVIALCHKSGLDWESIGLYRQGVAAKPDENPPTVIITLASCPSPVLFGKASRLVDDIEKHMEPLFPDVHVEAITYKYPEPYADDTTDNNRSGDDMIDSVASRYNGAPPGRSIGPISTTGTGSLSGYIRICGGDTTKESAGHDNTSKDTEASSLTTTSVQAITCHHVVSHGLPDQLLPLSSRDAVTLTCPAEGDHALYTENIRERLDAARGIISRNKARQERALEQGKDGSALDIDNAILEKEVQRLGNHAEHVMKIWDTVKTFGTVMKSSGIAAPEPGLGLADWAIIQPDAGSWRTRQQQASIDEVRGGAEEEEAARLVCKKLGVPPPPSSMLDDVAGFFSPRVELPVVPKAQIRALCRSSDEEDPVYVYLRGRTTPFGVGMLHDVHDEVRINYAATKDAIGKTVQREFSSRELVVLDIRRSGTGCPVFSAKGDSGAPVRLVSGAVVGFVLASFKEAQPRPVTYIAVAEDVMESVAKATGAKEVYLVGGDSLEPRDV